MSLHGPAWIMLRTDVAVSSVNAWISMLMHAQGDDLTDRFFRNLTELAVIHCLNSQQPGQPAAQQQPGQPAGAPPLPALNFVAIDALVRLTVCLVTGAFIALHPYH